jgi:hypothetical protein
MRQYPKFWQGGVRRPVAFLRRPVRNIGRDAGRRKFVRILVPARLAHKRRDWRRRGDVGGGGTRRFRSGTAPCTSASADRASLSSGQVDEFMVPIVMRMGKGDEPMVLDQMRRQLRARYGEFAEIVLLFMLRTYRHGGTEQLLALATEKAAA